MMFEEPSSSQAQSSSRIIEDVRGCLDSDGFELMMVPHEVVKEMGTTVRVTDEVLQERYPRQRL